MNIPFADGSAILLGNVLDRIKDIPDTSVHCIVTSPPYWGLRNYRVEPSIWGGSATCEHDWATSTYYTEKSAAVTSTEAMSEAGADNAERVKQARWRTDDHCHKCGAWRGQLGLEPTPDMFVAHLVQVFAECHRILRADGTMWVNMGDSFNNRSTARNSSHQTGLGFTSADLDTSWRDQTAAGRTRMSVVSGDLKEKDLVGVPWMLAFALRAAGWYLRSDVIWAKGVSFAQSYHGAVLPEPVHDRPAKAHEHLFLLTKSPRYYYDAHTVREASVNVVGTGRHLRDVWCVKIQPFKDAHYAVMPEALARPCIQAGTSAHGVCRTCGAPWKRLTTKGYVAPEGVHAGWWQQSRRTNDMPKVRARSGGGLGTARRRESHGLKPVEGTFQEGVTYSTVGWEMTCTCAETPPAPSTVFDPFFGAGTTGLVANKLGQKFIGCELNRESAEIALNRITKYQESIPTSLF